MAGSPLKKSKKSKFKFKIDTSWKNLVLYGFLILMASFLFLGLTTPKQPANTVPLSQVIKDVKDGKVSEITISDNKLSVKKTNETVEAFKEPGSSVYQLFSDAGVKLDKTKVVVKDETGMNSWINILSSVIPIILMVAFFWFIFRQARGAQESIFSFGQSRAKLFSKPSRNLPKSSISSKTRVNRKLWERVRQKVF
jgi:cell division protease FtsH